MKAIMGTLILMTAATTFAAPISQPFYMNFHDYTDKHENLEVRLEVKCSYKNLLVSNSNDMEESCGESAHTLFIENDGKVYVPAIEAMESLKKENYKFNFVIMKNKDNGQRVYLNEQNPLMLKVHSARTEIDVAFYHCPKLNMSGENLTYRCMSQEMSKNGGYALEPKNMGDASKVSVFVQKGSKVLIDERVDYKQLSEVLESKLNNK